MLTLSLAVAHAGMATFTDAGDDVTRGLDAAGLDDRFTFHVECPYQLAEAPLASGRIVAKGEPERSRRGYWLIAPLPQWRQKKVKALVAALSGQ